MKRILLLILALCTYTVMIYSDIAWSTPVSISTAAVDATDPHVVIDSNGNVTVAWIENSTIKATSLPFGGSWSSVVGLSNLSNTASSPKLGVDLSGNVTALWIENSVVETATLPFGGTWSASATVSAGGASSLSFDVDAAGNAVAIWVRGDKIESSTRVSGIWSVATVLSTLTSSNPHVKISSNGKAIAVWHVFSSGNDVIVSAILTINTNSWSATKTIIPGTAASNNYPKVTIDPNGNATAAWYHYNFSNGAYSNVQVFSSTLINGASSWGLPTILSAGGIGNPANLTLKLKADVSGDCMDEPL